MKYAILNGSVAYTIYDTLKHSFARRHMCLCEGPVYYHNMALTAHYKNSILVRGHLEQHGFQNETFSHFWGSLSKPNAIGLLMYCGHGYKSGSGEHWQVSDTEFTKRCRNIHKDSRLLVVMDCCFADGMLDADLHNVCILSASRAWGKHSSAFYTGDGGYMSHCFTQLCNGLQKGMQDSAGLYAMMLKMYHPDLDHDEGPILLGSRDILFP